MTGPSDGHWSDAETALLLEWWRGGKSAEQIARKVGRTRNSVIGKIHRIRRDGVAVPNTPEKAAMAKRAATAPWTAADELAAQERVRRGDCFDDIAADLGRTVTALATRVSRWRKRGVDLPDCRTSGRRSAPSTPGGSDFWTKEDSDELVMRWNAGEPAATIGARLGRSAGAVQRRVRTLRQAGAYLERRVGGMWNIRRSASPEAIAERSKVAKRQAERMADRTETPLAGGAATPITETRHGQCRWPLWGSVEDGRARNFPVCGQPVAPEADRSGVEYCRHHLRRATGTAPQHSGHKEAENA